MADLIGRLRAFEGSDELGNGDFSLLTEAATEIERLRAEVAEAREFRDKLAKAIGNEQLRMFIEKHGEPVPLTIRMQAAEARAERLAEALEDIRSRSSIDFFAMRSGPFELTALLGDIHQIAGAALAQEADRE